MTLDRIVRQEVRNWARRSHLTLDGNLYIPMTEVFQSPKAICEVDPENRTGS